jgi:hypothetical protein
MCMHPLPPGKNGVVLIQFGRTFFTLASPVAPGCATMITGTDGSKNWYIQAMSREYDDRIAKDISDF